MRKDWIRRGAFCLSGTWLVVLAGCGTSPDSTQPQQVATDAVDDIDAVDSGGSVRVDVDRQPDEPDRDTGVPPVDAGSDAEAEIPDTDVSADADADAPTPIDCATLDCASQGRVCDEATSGADASCGRCLGDLVEAGGLCVAPGPCSDDSECVPTRLVGDWSECGGYADECSTTGVRSREAYAGRCSSGVCTVLTTEQTEPCPESRATDGEPCLAEGVASQCSAGACLGGCASGLRSHVGCEFWAIDLDQFGVACTSASNCGTGQTCRPDGYCSNTGRTTPFGVSVSNGSTRDVTVVAYNNDDVELARATIGSLDLATLALPQAAFDDTSINTDAVRIVADGPVTMHQFNPTSNVGAFSNDASLLLPATAVGREYIINGYPGLGVASGQVSPGKPYIAVIAVAEGNTEVTVTPTTSTLASGDGAIASIAAGVAQTFSLNQGESLTLSGGSAEGTDFSGTIVSATRPISVFSGTECSGIPAGVAYCDHIEEQLPPVDTWGVEFVGAGFKKRGTEDTVWRIVASVDGTRIRTEPDSIEANEQILDRGEVFEFRSGDDFFIGASAPVSVGAFMVGSGYPRAGGTCDRTNPFGGSSCAIPASCSSGSGIGDPAFMITVPNEQFRRDYIVLTPDEYDVDYLSIVAPVGAVITVDGLPPSNLEATVGGYNVFRPLVEDGVHRVEGNQEFGLYAYGYDCDVSYAYPGGMNLESVSP